MDIDAQLVLSNGSGAVNAEGVALLEAELNSGEVVEVSDLVGQLSSKGVGYAAISFVDLHGKIKAKIVPLGHLEQASKGSELFTGAALDGVPQEVSDDEVAAHPDLTSAIVMPWNPEMAWFPSDLWLAGSPFEACSRNILKRVVAKAKEDGFVLNLGVETEFYVFQDGPDGPQPVAESDTLDKPCYDLRGLLHNFSFVKELVEAMNALGWDVYSFDHEDANGQFETDFDYTNVLQMADRLVFFRLMAGEMAKAKGYFVSFMPKPFANQTGNAAHFNMSLADSSGMNLFEERDDPRGCKLSELGYAFIAGVLRHAPAITAVIAPTVNSYKRLVRGGSSSGFTWAPVLACYGNNNRTNMLRIPLQGGRVECRAADGSVNPYLGAALIFAAGLEGVREHLDPGDPNTENMYLLSDVELAERGIELLPRTLGAAIDAFERDPLSREVFGEEMFRSFIDTKRSEWESYSVHVSAWETERYLRFF